MNPIALIATKKGLFQLGDDFSLTPAGFLGVAVSMVLAKPDGFWYAGLNHGHFGVKFHRSYDQGATWQEMSTPQYPQQENGVSLSLIWSLEFANKDSDDTLWAGTIPGGLFHSADAGESWQLNGSLWQHKVTQQWFGGGYDEAGIHSICVHPDDPTHIDIAVSCAGVWQSKDNGISWQSRSEGMKADYMPPEQQLLGNIQDPHRLVRSPSSPETLWVQHHNGIYKSLDGTHSWTEINTATPSHFGFSVAVHPNNGDIAWFVPAIKDECRIPVDGKLVVMKTTDGGQSFTSHSNGLADTPSYDLVYRHSLDVDKSGDLLLMGSTTGNLWLSDDQGESWRCLSHHLPPIFAVRFIK